MSAFLLTSYTLLKGLHLFGILLIFMGYGALIAQSQSPPKDKGLKRLTGMFVGIGLLLSLLTGLSMLGFLSGAKGWIVIKLAVWVALGFGLVWVRRKPQHAIYTYCVALVLGAIAIAAVLMRPF